MVSFINFFSYANNLIYLMCVNPIGTWHSTFHYQHFNQLSIIYNLISTNIWCAILNKIEVMFDFKCDWTLTSIRLMRIAQRRRVQSRLSWIKLLYNSSMRFYNMLQKCKSSRCVQILHVFNFYTNFCHSHNHTISLWWLNTLILLLLKMFQFNSIMYRSKPQKSFALADRHYNPLISR